MTTRFTAALVVALIFSASASPAAASNPYGSRAGGTSDSTPARANPPAHDVALGPTTPTVSSLNEGFDNITTLVGNGWSLQNNSAPRGTTDWTQGPSVGGGGPFDAFDGAVNAYISTNYNNVGSSGTISNWMLTPELSFGAGATLTFYTRKVAPDAYADRLEVRLSSNGASTNVGTTATTLGDFTTLALSINPNLVLGVYPTIWTQYTITGLPHSGNGRLAFRYYVTSAGSSGSNSDFVGIDRVVYNTGAPEYQVGGNVAGLAGSGLLLRLNGSIDLPIGADGSFQFPTYITDGQNYAVTVATQPSSLNQTCTVSNGTGTITGTVTNVSVSCTTSTYSVAGSVSGLAGSGLTLQLNGGQDLTVAGNGAFSFPSALADGSAYAVSVTTQPAIPNQNCVLENASGTLAGSNVSNITLACTTSTYSIGGDVSGLVGSGLKFQLNGGQDLSVTADGGFTFADPLADGSSYSVTVATQPSGPNQNCVVANASGTLAGSNVSNITVTCTTSNYAIGGNVSGLAGSGLTLQLNGGQDLAVTANGTFVFPASLADGSAYVVSVATQPANLSQICVVSNGAGALTGADIDTVQISCSTSTWFIGGHVSGVLGSGLLLHLDDGQNVAVSTNGSFMFGEPREDGSAWVVTVAASPTNPNQNCAVVDGSGTLAGSDVTGVQVACAIVSHTVGGNVVGLEGDGLVLQLNNGDDLPVPADGAFTFSQRIEEGAAYVVSILSQPVGGASHVCVVENGSGSMNTLPIHDVLVTCDVIYIDGFDIP